MDEKKIKEAIEYFKLMLFDMEEMRFKHVPKYYKTAVEALEKQLPKRVENRTEYRNLYGHLIFYKGFCPSCGRIVESYRNNSCHVCTQRLDWLEDRKVKE